ncbi:unnamed protein product [Ostreobium quekettii]|uniref:Uncharacterized protein n=1 Tax=Ostreobium quekettii TaxID=121088 RepID=A0A8S1ITJ8_9CHLO|nr:unnamed protein product [Ostreobium quekettii]|eukprot:evm.model.scf_400.1 EVM.evm.TU.scf_400.1   scf_400:52276-55859(-)
MARACRASLLLAVIALAGFAGVSNGQVLIDVLNGVSEECKDNIVWFATNCSDDFAAAGEALGFGWPPTESLDIDTAAAEDYFKDLEEIAPGCCKALCDLAQSKCMCDDDTHGAITKTLFSDDGAFFVKMLEFGGSKCGHKPTVKNLKKTCKKAAKNVCT